MSNKLRTQYQALQVKRTQLAAQGAINPSKKLDREICGLDYQMGMMTALCPEVADKPVKAAKTALTVEC